MGMTIDNAIGFLKDIDDPLYFSQEICNAAKVAMDTMRKYQKITEIMHKIYESDNADMCLVQRLAEIREVIEDGNIK